MTFRSMRRTFLALAILSVGLLMLSPAAWAQLTFRGGINGTVTDASGAVVKDATVEATEEAIVNAMVAAQDMTGVDDHRVIALPHAALRSVLKKYNRLLP